MENSRLEFGTIEKEKPKLEVEPIEIRNKYDP
jgi:hypothetical protein